MSKKYKIRRTMSKNLVGLRDMYDFFFKSMSLLKKKNKTQLLHIGKLTISCHYRVKDFQRAQEHKSSRTPSNYRFNHFLRIQRR